MKNFNPDSSQKKIIEVSEGEHLVLAPPGCGKTQILTERIRYAHECGVEYTDMLCLTFTNRAARGMRERIRENIADAGVAEVFVGNLHRYCSRFLFDNAIIPVETGVIDEDDTISIIARFLNEEEDLLAKSFKRRKECFECVQLSDFMYQVEKRHPKQLRLHPECLNGNDVAAIKVICEKERMEVTPESFLRIFNNVDSYRDSLSTPRYNDVDQKPLRYLLHKLETAHFYHQYKKENHLLDFEDLLLLTYDALVADKEHKYKRYRWCQVDEVQDLNPLQIAIVDALTDVENKCLVMLGDEQQAIFSFMGAKLSTLDQLKQRCNGRLHHLSVNHRSPRYLLDVYNTYARNVLNIDPSLLPTTDLCPQLVGNELSLYTSATQDYEYGDVAQQAARIHNLYPDETVAVLVTSNADAEMISRRMHEQNLSHFKVSGTDMFSLPEVKLLLAHLSVFSQEHNFLAWARLLKGLHVYEQAAAARAFVRQLINNALLPTDFMFREGSSYVMDFAKDYESQEIVVFDTETTGLNVLDDDILQIAAMKMKDGKVVPDSSFSVYIATDREIPQMLGDIVNPIVEEMKHQHLYSHEEALQMFMDYVGDAVLLGHNADYDYHILDANLKKYLPDVVLSEKYPVYYDSLKLARLLEPHLHQYKLKHLLEVLHLEGENSHLADADVAATCNLVNYLYKCAKEIIPKQKDFLEARTTKERAQAIRVKMRPIYRATASRLWLRQEGNYPAICRELKAFYDYLVRERIIQPVGGFDYIVKYIDCEMVNLDEEWSLHDQIAAHSLELTTLKESDLCSENIIDEKVFVSTVHKAKGLEFDNVIVFDVASDRYPGFFAQNDPSLKQEDARKLYVALTRTKKRLMLANAEIRHDMRNCPHERTFSPFLKTILPYFRDMSFVDAEE